MWIAVASLIITGILAVFIIVVTVFGLLAWHLIVALTISLVVLGTASLLAGIASWLLRPRPIRDHYETPFGDVPKVMHGG